MATRVSDEGEEERRNEVRAWRAECGLGSNETTWDADMLSGGARSGITWLKLCTHGSQSHAQY